MSSQHRRIYRKRAKPDRVICVNCNVLLKFDDGKSGYRKRYPLTNRLQDRKWDPSQKPGISILEGLVETIPELAAGNISQILSTMCLCHGCTILLRQAVNYRFKVQNLLVELQQKIGSITDEMRQETNQLAKKADKAIKCWLCQEKFSNEASKTAMHRHILDEMTVNEAIETLLPDESVTLQGVSKKHLLVCKSCFKILNKIITVQCQAEKTRQSFIETTSEDGLISKIQEYGDDFNDFEEDILDDVEDIENEDLDAPETIKEDLTVKKTGSSVATESCESDLGETQTQSMKLSVLTDSSSQSGIKRKLEEICSQTGEEIDGKVIKEELVDEEEFGDPESLDHELEEHLDDNHIKRRKSNIDLLSILQATQLQNEAFSDNLIEPDNSEGRLIVDEGNKVEPLCENVLKKVVYYLQQNLFDKALRVLQRNCSEFEKEIHRLVVNGVLKEVSGSNDLENSDWSKLSTLSSGDVTVESFIKAFQERLPLLSTVLNSSVSGLRQIDFSQIEKTTLLRLLTVMGVIAFQRNPNCHLVQSLNSIQMAEDGCTSELYNTFHGLGLCLKEKDTQILLSTPDYSTDKVCWDLLKEVQETKGSAAAKTDKNKVVKEENILEGEEEEDELDIPDDFADVCPYWKLPTETRPTAIDSSEDEWVLYYNPKIAGRAEFIRLIFEEAGVTYHEESHERLQELMDGKIEGYPVLDLPIVRKGSFKLAQTPVICRYLGELFDLYPDCLEDRLHAEQISQTCHDYIVEGMLSLDGTDLVVRDNIHKEKTKSYRDKFIKHRIPRFLTFFETVLKTNNGGSGFLFGNKVTYADLAILHILRVTESQFPDTYKQTNSIPQLKAFKDKLSLRPRLKSYFESDRCNPITRDSTV